MYTYLLRNLSYASGSPVAAGYKLFNENIDTSMATYIIQITNIDKLSNSYNGIKTK